MLTEIYMDGVASFKQPVSLVTDKKINLLYGLNGTGKSTISDFLYDPSDPRFARCGKQPDNTSPILVYNQRFIQENFYVADGLQGIFSLSKENKKAEEKIAQGVKRKNELEKALEDKQAAKTQVEHRLSAEKLRAVDEVWKIKTAYSGGDRLLEYCLEGLKGQKERLFSHLLAIPRPDGEPTKTISDVYREVASLKGEKVDLQPRLSLLALQLEEIERDGLLGTAIVGNTDSEVAALIEKLENADWVKQGLDYVAFEPEGTVEACPFCQEATITSKFLSDIKAYFDVTFEQQVEALERLDKRYQAELDRMPPIETYSSHPLASGFEPTLSQKYQELAEIINDNQAKIRQKLRSPKVPIELGISDRNLSEFNDVLRTLNSAVERYNDRLKNREDTLKGLKDDFWSIMRWKYDQTLTRYGFYPDFPDTLIKGCSTVSDAC